jgi:hypothetical protein
MPTVAEAPRYRPTETLAREIVEPFVSKTLAKAAGVRLSALIEQLVRMRTAALLTFGPMETARIAREERLEEAQVRAVLTHAGGRCVSDEGLAEAWGREIEPGVMRDFLGSEERKRLDDEITLLLHASRDGMRNKGVDTTQVPFDMHFDGGYYNEAFGMVRALALLGYGYLAGGRSEDPMNLIAFFDRIKVRVLEDEGYFSKTHTCDHCLARYGKDGSRKR